MQRKPAAVEINLVPKDPFYDTLLGRILKWALSAGRYIVIFTELVVIASFATRFTLDRQVTDLNTSILQKQVLVESYGELETEFRAAQDKIAEYSKFTAQEPLLDNFKYMSEVTPPGVTLDEMVINRNSVVARGVTTSQSAFNIFVNNLQLSPHFVGVSLDSVESEDDADQPGLAFRLRATTNQVRKVSNPTTSTLSPTQTAP